MGQDRRNFIKSVSAVGATIGVGGISQLVANSPVQHDLMSEKAYPSEFEVTILQTTDIHCQIHPKDELFWENNEKVYRKTGGYAHLSTYLKKKKKKK
ncbi:MAG: twin-arginine translocation signal domain-containing protein, partial [Saprospiraceae bacterium]|nr:twin-arginine translocation signal domain-containing protein [Saprospiraceae bacterium]